MVGCGHGDEGHGRGHARVVRHRPARSSTPRCRSIDDLPGFHAAALAHLALLDLADGDDEAAVERSEAAQTLVDKYDLCDVVPMIVVYATSAVMAARVAIWPASGRRWW